MEEEKQTIKDNLEVTFEKPEVGGQVLELTQRNKVRVYSPHLDVEIAVGRYRSQVRNKEAAISLMEFVTDNLIKKLW